MQRWGYIDKTDEEIRMMVRRLVWEYPSHGFVIDAQEAQEIGLTIEILDDDSQELCVKLLEYTEHPVWFAFPNIDTEQNEAEDGLPWMENEMDVYEGGECEKLPE